MLQFASAIRDGDTGFSAFFVSNELVRRGHLDLVARTLKEKGFDTLLRVDIDDKLRRKLRGWMPSVAPTVLPDDVSVVLFVHDLLPIEPDDSQRRRHPHCDNARALIARVAIRVEVNRLARWTRTEAPAIPVESSRVAWSLLDALAPDRRPALEQAIAQQKEAFVTGPAIRDLSRFSCRARVELIQYNGRKAVRKTFRPGAEQFLQRELDVFKLLSPHSDAIPQLLEHGRNYFIMEHIDEADQLPLPEPGKLLPLAQVRQLAEFVRTCVAHGLDPVDLKPEGNALYTRNGLKIIDYEFWRRCDPATRPEESYSIAGLPADFTGDRPWGVKFPFDPYPRKWVNLTGLSPRSFLYDPAWLQAIKRRIWLMNKLPRRVAGAIKRRILRRLPVGGNSTTPFQSAPALR